MSTLPTLPKIGSDPALGSTGYGNNSFNLGAPVTWDTSPNNPTLSGLPSPISSIHFGGDPSVTGSSSQGGDPSIPFPNGGEGDPSIPAGATGPTLASIEKALSGWDVTRIVTIILGLMLVAAGVFSFSHVQDAVEKVGALAA